MAEPVVHKPPLPAALTFLTCREIWRDPRTGKTMLQEPMTHVRLERFPAPVRLSVFAEFTGGHGDYVPRLALHDADDEIVWGWSGKQPFAHRDPLLPSEVCIFDLMMAVPKPGRYTLILLLNGAESARRSLWFNVAELRAKPVHNEA